MRPSFIVALVALSACSREPSPSPAPPASVSAAVTAAACKTDADCVLVAAVPPSCCSRCSSEAMTKKEAEDANRTCAAITSKRADYFASCPHLSCPCTKDKPACAKGHCTTSSAPCQ